ncbi:hypothetical protein QUC31_006207, partial [Theobroma cacao]
VEARDDNAIGALLYGFSEKPESSRETNWSASNILIVGSYGRKVISDCTIINIMKSLRQLQTLPL